MSAGARAAALRVRVRAAVPADAPAMGRVQVLSWRKAYAGLLPDDKLARLDEAAATLRWQVRLDNPMNHVSSYVAEDERGVVVGYVAVGPCREGVEPEGVAELWALYALPDVWGAGVGRALFAAGEAALAARGHDEFVLWVLPDNVRARRFYERQGMYADGGAKNFMEDGAAVPHVRYRKRR